MPGIKRKSLRRSPDLKTLGKVFGDLFPDVAANAVSGSSIVAPVVEHSTSDWKDRDSNPRVMLFSSCSFLKINQLI